MQAREAKHVRLAQYAKHSTKSTRWSMVLRHDYNANVYIRKHDPGRSSYTKYEERYIPKQVALETFCCCGVPIGAIPFNIHTPLLTRFSEGVEE